MCTTLKELFWIVSALLGFELCVPRVFTPPIGFWHD